jgi:hypothetical protein
MEIAPSSPLKIYRHIRGHSYSRHHCNDCKRAAVATRLPTLRRAMSGMIPPS